MRILVTGGSGFVGSHAALALQRTGHELRFLARDRARLSRLARARGIDAADVVVGDMADAAAVKAALDGCDAALHAAAAVEIGAARDVFATNLAGIRNLLGLALERGLDPVVHVSSIATMFPPPGPRITVSDPVASLATGYGRSKAEGERFARALQARGAPLVTVYPSGVYGPDDPGPGQAMKGLRDRIRIGWLRTTGGSACVDVRDLAEILSACFERGRGPRRYMAGGHFASWMEEADLVEELIGRRVRRIPAHPSLVCGIGRSVDLLKRVVPSLDYPLTYEASLFLTQLVPCDSSATLAELGRGFRPMRETLHDAIRWMLATGMLPRRCAPALAGRKESPETPRV
jgi:nucleoside-diphosphate-sugar epimerase